MGFLPKLELLNSDEKLENLSLPGYIKDMRALPDHLMRMFILAIFLLATGCEEPDFFGEYSGKNFLPSDSLGPDGNWQLMPDYTFEEGTLAKNYMGFSPKDGELGPRGGPVYRLEIKNLLRNGDFEDPAIDDVWLTNGTKSYIPSTAPLALEGRSLKYNVNKDQMLYFNCPKALINEKCYLYDKSYLFSYDYRCGETQKSYFLLNSADSSAGPSKTEITGSSYRFTAYGGQNGQQEEPSTKNSNTFPPLDILKAQSQRINNFTTKMPASGNINRFIFFPGASQVAVIDNFKLIRDTEGPFDLRLRLKLSLNDNNGLKLIPGYYRFSLWVKEAGTLPLNTFYADRIELGIESHDRRNLMDIKDYQVFYKTRELHNLYALNGRSFLDGRHPLTESSSLNWGENWVQLVLSSSQLIQLPDQSEEPVMELTISPSNPGPTDSGWNRLSPGVILIADPELEFSPVPW